MGKMNSHYVASSLVGVLLFVLASNVPGETRRALLIGINEYQTEEFADLRGAVNDVETMREILISRYGFPESNVVVLTDRLATRQAILDALNRLVEQTTTDDMVYVHYSGHGSQVQDMSGDEADQLDETILPHDARTKNIPDITDDEIGEFLSRLQASNAIVVLDSCHSGTATRGGIATRSVPPDARLELYKSRVADVATRSIVPIDIPDQYILFSGAASHQSALDGPVDGKYRGFFSYALAEALKDVEPLASPRDIHKHIEQTYQKLSQKFGGLKLPDPQFEADNALLDNPLFVMTQSAESNKAFLSVLVDRKARGRLIRGSAMDAGPGSYWAIFAADETNFSLARALAKAIVVRMDKADSIVEFEGPTLDRGTSYRAVPLPNPAMPEAVLVRLEIENSELATELGLHIADRVAGVQFVGVDKFARFVVTADDSKLRVFDAAGIVAIDEFQLTSIVEAGDKLADLLNRSKSVVSLSNMTNPLSGLQINARIVGAASANEIFIRRQNETRSNRNSVMLQIDVNADSYLTVIDIDPEGTVTVLFPNSYTSAGFLPDGFVRAGATTYIPDSLAPGNRAGFFWDYSPPAGLDTIQVFATTDLDTATKIRSWMASLDAVTARGMAPSVDHSRPLSDLQNDLAENIRSRAIRVVQDDASASQQTGLADATVRIPTESDWNSVTLSIRVSE